MTRKRFAVDLPGGTTELVEADYGVLHADGSLSFHNGNPLMAVLGEGDRLFTEGSYDAPPASPA